MNNLSKEQIEAILWAILTLAEMTRVNNQDLDAVESVRFRLNNAVSNLQNQFKED